MPYLSCKKIENDVYNFPTWQYCKYKDIFDSRIIINSTAKFYISISYHKDLLSIDTRIFTPSFLIPIFLPFGQEASLALKSSVNFYLVVDPNPPFLTAVASSSTVIPYSTKIPCINP